ncbi:amidohydrolase [Rummeliibacillus pycnus]|uniref:amidohydrolase n=1 Tax=Rummeliibacillus pycnus TaxID=101070 RepID=UPI000C9B4A29|nr:amidohydrolase [Rummeliibacillus pycnus]
MYEKLLRTIYQDLENSFEEMQTIRRYLHMHPEVSFNEHKTAAYIQNFYRKLDIPFEANVGGNGVVAYLTGGKPGKTVALRADFDALPIQDEKEVSYRSTVAGVSHACGHDGHTATLLILAKILLAHRSEIPGTYVLIHQFAEEVAPGGAKPMIEAGCLTGVDAIFGTHLWSQFPLGTIHYRSGPMMAGADNFTIKIIGNGGHGGAPHTTIDAVTVGAELVVQLQQIIARRINPTHPAVLTIGSFHSGSAFNIIAGEATLTGTVRTFDVTVREKIIEEMERVVKGVCFAANADYEFHYLRGYIPLINHEKETVFMARVAETIPGITEVAEMDAVMVGEDFGYYVEKIPGTFFFTGAKPKEGIAYPHHHAKFDFAEEAMLIAAKTLGTAAILYHNHK